MYDLKKPAFFSLLIGLGLFGSSAIGVLDISDDSNDDSTQSDDTQDYIEPWMYISLPDAGTYSMREVLEEGTPGWDAFALAGHPIEDYEPTEIFMTNTVMNSHGIVVLMLAQHCLGDFNDDGQVNAGDIALFTHAYLEGDLAADLTGNGVVDIFDQLFFIELANMGCVAI